MSSSLSNHIVEAKTMFQFENRLDRHWENHPMKYDFTAEYDMSDYLSLQNFCLFTSAIDFNVVNPSNNTFNRQKIIITIFVNETKCIFEKNLKKTLQN
jgi:hypothetical protein